MTNHQPTSSCNSLLLNRFLDGELTADESKRVQMHMDACATCRREVMDSRTFSNNFQEVIANEHSRVNFAAVENRIIVRLKDRQTSWKTQAMDFIRLKRFYFPASALSAAAILLFALFYPADTPPVSSAIITSFTGEFTSVTIIETPKTHQTILWFNEAVPENGESHAL